MVSRASEGKIWIISWKFGIALPCTEIDEIVRASVMINGESAESINVGTDESNIDEAMHGGVLLVIGESMCLKAKSNILNVSKCRVGLHLEFAQKRRQGHGQRYLQSHGCSNWQIHEGHHRWPSIFMVLNNQVVFGFDMGESPFWTQQRRSIRRYWCLMIYLKDTNENRTP